MSENLITMLIANHVNSDHKRDKDTGEVTVCTDAVLRRLPPDAWDTVNRIIIVRLSRLNPENLVIYSQVHDGINAVSETQALQMIPGLVKSFAGNLGPPRRHPDESTHFDMDISDNLSGSRSALLVFHCSAEESKFMVENGVTVAPGVAAPLAILGSYLNHRHDVLQKPVFVDATGQTVMVYCNHYDDGNMKNAFKYALGILVGDTRDPQKFRTPVFYDPKIKND